VTTTNYCYVAILGCALTWSAAGFFFSDLSQFCDTFWNPENEYKGNAQVLWANFAENRVD
jgi:hypothetical protein